MTENLAPIILFVYNRPWHTQQTLDALAKNELAKESILYIYADGTKENATEQGLQKINEVREIISNFEGCKETHIVEREKNWGLANNVIEGITKVVNQYGKIIVLEDDIVTSNYFLIFMNGNLDMYSDKETIYGITSNALFENTKLPSTFLLPIGSSWGWATWKNKWNIFEENSQILIDRIKEENLQEKMNFGNYPFFQMLESQNNKLIDSWAIRFYASFFLQKGLFIHPNQSLSYNIGMDNTGTHCDDNMPFNNRLYQNSINYTNLQKSKKAIKYIEKEFTKKFSVTKGENIFSKIKKKYIMINFLKKIRNRITYNNIIANQIEEFISSSNSSKIAINQEIETVKLLQGKMMINLLKEKYKPNQNIQDFEFKVFSQWGDDGIIQYLIHVLDIKNKFFIEFGVENYLESNTRFLLMNNNWSGLVMDGSDKNINYIKNDTIYWKYGLNAKASFITRENINTLISQEGIKGEIGLLHIDIDGVDYWVWKEIEVIDPIIVILEYNSNFGDKRAITVPYRPDFERSKAHFSGLFVGASLSALVLLAQEKGYVFIGCNSNGNNAYFVQKKYESVLNNMTIEEGYVESKFREARDQHGKLTFMNGKKALNSIKELEVYNISTNETESL